MTDDDLSVSVPLTVVRLADGTLDLVGEVEEDDVRYSPEPPHQITGGYRDGVWVDADQLTPVAPAAGPDGARPYTTDLIHVLRGLPRVRRPDGSETD